MDDRRSLHIGMVVTYDLCEPGGGVKQHALQLADALRRSGDRVTILGPASRMIRQPDVCAFTGVANVSSNGSDNRIGILVNPLAVRRFLREAQFDVLHIHEPLLPSLPYYVSWFSRNTPKVATFHAYAERCSPRVLLGRRLFSPLVLPGIHSGIAVSEPAARHARIDWRGPLKVIPNGIATSAFPPGPHRDTRNGLRFLFVGRIGDERKGFRYLVEAVRRTRALGLDIELHAVGELSPGLGPDFGPGIVHHGPVSAANLAAWYRASDVFVAPSTGQESFGMVLLEAMATARPIICSEIEGYRQSANPVGTRWVPPRNVDALQKALIELALRPDERRRLGESNARYVRRFDWSALAPRIRTEYLRTMLRLHMGATQTGFPPSQAVAGFRHDTGRAVTELTTGAASDA